VLQVVGLVVCALRNLVLWQVELRVRERVRLPSLRRRQWQQRWRKPILRLWMVLLLQVKEVWRMLQWWWWGGEGAEETGVWKEQRMK